MRVTTKARPCKRIGLQSPHQCRDTGSGGVEMEDLHGGRVKVDTGYKVHDEGVTRDMFCKQADGKRFQGPVWPGNCFFPVPKVGVG